MITGLSMNSISMIGIDNFLHQQLLFSQTRMLIYKKCSIDKNDEQRVGIIMDIVLTGIATILICKSMLYT